MQFSDLETSFNKKNCILLELRGVEDWYCRGTHHVDHGE